MKNNGFMNMKAAVAVLFAIMLVVTIVPYTFADDGNGSSTATNEGADNSTITNGSGAVANQRRGDDYRPKPKEFPGAGRGPERGEGREWLNGTNNRTQFRNDTKEQRELLKEQREQGRENRTDAREQARENAKEIHEEIKQRREEIKQKMETFREEAKNARERLKELQTDYKAQRDGWNEAKDALKTCREDKQSNGTNSTKCKEVKAKFNDEGKRFIGNAAQQMLAHIEDVKTRVKADPYLSNDTASSVVAQLDAHIAKITADKAAVDALQNSSDVNATKQAATQLRNDWQTAQVTVRLTRQLLAHTQYQRFLDQLDVMSQSFKEARDTLAAQGKDVTKLDADLASFNTKLSGAETGFANAKNSYVSAMSTVTTDADATTLIKSTNEQLKSVRAEVQSARDDLKSIIKDISGLDANVLKSVAAKVKASSLEIESTDVEGGAQ